jgi:hypothetical protein
MKRYGGVEVQFQAFLVTLNGSELLDSLLGSFTQKPVFAHDLFSVYLTTIFLTSQFTFRQNYDWKL